MGSRYLTDLADVLRRAGLEVVELDGWKTRARGSGGYESGRPTTIMVHHTASPPAASGRRDAEYCALYDDDAPLSNLCLDRDGVWWVLAAGATNTNGKGGPLGGVPADSMNTWAIGVEANGGPFADWPKVQTDSYVRGVRQLATHYGCPNVYAHFEWAPTRKIDPAGPSPWSPDQGKWDMHGFRATITGSPVAPTEEDDMPLTDEDIDKIARAVWSYQVGAGGGAEPQTSSWWITRIHGIARRYLGPYNANPPPDPTLLSKIDEQTR